MWERVAASAIVLAGAIVLFGVFTAILLIIERREIKKQPVRLRVIRCQNKDNEAA